MVQQSEEMAQTGNERFRELNIPSRPKISQRKSSFSEAFNKFTSNTFNRRRTDAGISGSTSPTSIHRPSRIPTPAGIDRSASFFSTLNTFASKSTVSISEESPQPLNTKRCRRISERLAQTPFFSHQYQQQSTSTPKKTREPSVKIEQRGLMQPVHPPLPRSNTIGSPGQSQQSSPHTPSFMRPTTSSTRRSSAMGRSNTAAPSSMAGRGSVALQRQRNSSLRTITSPNTPSKTPTQARHNPARKFPPRTDSFVSALSTMGKSVPAIQAESKAKQPDMPADYSDGANFQVTDQHSQDISYAKESTNSKPKTSIDHVHPTRQLPQPKESTKGILKSKGKKSQFSEAFSNLYSDEEEADSGKGGLENDEVKTCSEQGSPDYSERTATPDSSNPRVIHEAQPAMWWLGRYTALSDRFRTGALPSPQPSSSSSSSSSTTEPMVATAASSSSNGNHPMHDPDRRNRRVYIHLRSLCTTDEARASLDKFKAIMEERERKMAGPQGKAVKEKQGWLEGLMGKKKKGEK